MKYEKQEIIILEFMGIPFLVIAYMILKIAYKASNKNYIVGLFSVVNDSVWGNLKIIFFSVVLFSIIEAVSLRKRPNNFFTAKAAEVIFMIILLIIISPLKKYNVFDGITFFIILCVLAQTLSFKILTLQKNYSYLNLLSFLFLIITSLIFFALAINPPINWIFQASKYLSNLLNF